MNGPAHYREAERLLDQLRSSTSDTGMDVLIAGTFAAAAQMHATLALVAATAAAQATAHYGDEDHSRSRGWAGVA